MSEQSIPLRSASMPSYGGKEIVLEHVEARIALEIEVLVLDDLDVGHGRRSDILRDSVPD